MSPGSTPSGVVTFTSLISSGVGLPGYLLVALWAYTQLEYSLENAHEMNDNDKMMDN